MSRIIAILGVLTLLLISTDIFGQGRKERYITATEALETQGTFIYQTQEVPVLDITYHEFSSDSATWRKNYVSGDCYVRMSNTISGGEPTNWWGYNLCAIDSIDANVIDTMFVYYYNNDTITYIDTILVSETVDIKIPAPDTITGSTTNFQDTATHTHAVYIDLNDIQDVNATPTDGQVLKWNASLGYWTAANDLVGGGGGGSITVAEQDGSPTVSAVNTIKVENGSLTNEGVGVVSIDFFQEAVDMPQDFYRAGEFSAIAGENFVDFTTPFSDNDYTLVQAYALYADSTRQNLVYDSLAADGFRVIGVIGSSTIHYLAMRDLDSLGLAAENQGKVLASGSDLTMSYLNGAVDDSTITVSNNELHVIPAFDSISFDTTYIPTETEPTGTMFWDQSEHTISAKLENDVTLQIGRELLIYGKNLSGSVIYNGMAVSIAAANGSFTAFELTDISTPNAYAFVGLATQDIAPNEFGYVTPMGLVHELDTDTLDEGKPVYVSVVPGVLTDTFPSPPNYIVNVGVTDYSHQTHGRINVIRSVVPRLEDLSDVDGTPLTKTGQLPIWNETEGYFDFDNNLKDTTATVNLSKAHIDTLTVSNITYSDSYWDDMSIPLVAAAPGANAPDLEPFRGSGILQRAFAGTSLNETMYVEGQFRHRIKEGSDISPHFHFSPSTTPVSTDTVVLVFEYSWVGIGNVFPVSNTLTVEIPMGSYSQWGHHLYATANIPYILKEASSVLIGRITRLQNDVSDTYNYDLFIFTFDIHYEIDKPGSNNEIPDY